VCSESERLLASDLILGSILPVGAPELGSKGSGHTKLGSAPGTATAPSAPASFKFGPTSPKSVLGAPLSSSSGGTVLKADVGYSLPALGSSHTNQPGTVAREADSVARLAFELGSKGAELSFAPLASSLATRPRSILGFSPQFQPPYPEPHTSTPNPQNMNPKPQPPIPKPYKSPQCFKACQIFVKSTRLVLILFLVHI
jgi:hypothetical protein